MDSAISLESKRSAFQKLSTDFSWLKDFVKEFQESVGQMDHTSNDFPPISNHAVSNLGNSPQILPSNREALISTSSRIPATQSVAPPIVCGNSFTSKDFPPLSSHADSVFRNSPHNISSDREAPISASSSIPATQSVSHPTVWDNPLPFVVPPASIPSEPQVAPLNLPTSSETIKPVKKGEFFSIQVGENLYKQNAKDYVDSLIVRVIYSKGDKPSPNLELQRKMEVIWETSSPLRLLPLGRGYFNVHFGSKEERDRAFRRQSWALKSGLMRLQKWILISIRIR